MTRKGSGNGSIAAVVAGVVALVFVVCGVLLGVDRAWPMARDAALGVAVDPLLARMTGAAGMPEVELRHDPDGTGVVRTSAGETPVRVRVEGDGILLDPQRPLADHPFARLALRTPATVDGVQGHAALWLAGIAGAPVADHALVQARVNGGPARLMELCEVVAPDMEQVRGLSPLPVQVGATVPVPAWAGADGFTGAAALRAATLDGILTDTLLTAYARRDTIAAVVDLDAYLRLLAAWQLLGYTPAQCTWTYSERTHRFMPVLVQAVLQADTTMAPDAGFAAIVLGDPAWRAQRDGHVHTAAGQVLADGRFDRSWDAWVRGLSAIPAQARAGTGDARQVEPSGAMRMEAAARVRAALQERLRTVTNTAAP